MVVVFPPVYHRERTADIARAGLPDDEISLITGETEGCVFRFKSIELWESFKKNYLQ
jgi:hypothetical protein